VFEIINSHAAGIFMKKTGKAGSLHLV